MKSPDFLDEVKRLHNLPSDRQLAKMLELDTGRVSLIRTGTRKMDAATALKVAHLLKVHPGVVLAEIQAERAKCTEVANTWHDIADSLKKATAALVLLTLGAASGLSPVAANSGISADFYGNNLYIMRRNRRKRRAA